MRIRKSQLFFPFSSLSPAPLSDPHLINPSPVVQLDDDIVLPPKPSPPSTLSDHPRPSDQLLPPIGRPTDLSDDPSGVAAVATDSGAHRQPQKQYGLEEDGRGPGEEGEKGNDTRKGSISGSQTVADHVLSPSSPSNQDERWCEGERAIPLKKRRGSFERTKVEEYDEVTQNNNKKEKTRMKTKMNKKCSRQNEDDNEDDVGEGGGERETKRERNAGRKRARGSAVMEGSRCSRVNGRGWRCCQQTLVGYSLCEHHLGKGRLRSITSVKTRSVPASATCSRKPEPHMLSQVSTSSSSVLKQTNEAEQDQVEKKPETMPKKRMKLGVVKARSISSLLGQTNTRVAALDRE
ncbi:uncharacterized protein LOC114763214 isoform X2 [Neltuma alba]|uniref:uncharacterized protein LOC114763214 isoform X2 n=1 Tax=Neltuma alba TaxID=207710 RepID=UPI0010A52979|nr:uncharacterized protein LOC114763214 isoform X2 [Prosopis alba]